MTRQPKPWFCVDRNVWCVTIDGVRHNLGRDRKEAFARFRVLMRQPRRQKVSNDSLAAIADAFLDWTYRNRAEATYDWYRERLQSFVTQHSHLPVEQLRPLHVETWASQRRRNVNIRRNLMRAV